MADVEAMLARIVDLANDINEIGLASLEYPDEKTDRIVDHLPFVFVEDGESTYQRLNNDYWRVTLEVRSLIYVSLISPENEATETIGRATSRAIKKVYIHQFMNRGRLQRDDSGISDIDDNGATIVNDFGSQTADRKTKIYTAYDVRHRIVYKEKVTEA